jgi:hypothetical protein
MYAACKNFRLAHRSKILLAGTQAGRMNAIICADIRLAKIQVVDRGGKRRQGRCSDAALSHLGGFSRCPQIELVG